MFLERIMNKEQGRLNVELSNLKKLLNSTFHVPRKNNEQGTRNKEG